MNLPPIRARIIARTQHVLRRAIHDDKFWKWPAIIGLAIVAAWFAVETFGADRIVQHHDSRGQSISITVTDDCHAMHAAEMNGAYADVPRNRLYLCGKREDAMGHELGHFAGMRHTVWYVNANHVSCARVLVAGYKTGYERGDWICLSRGPAHFGEWIEKN